MVSNGENAYTVLLDIGNDLGIDHRRLVDHDEIVVSIELLPLVPSEQLLGFVVDERTIEQPVDGAAERVLCLFAVWRIEQVRPVSTELALVVGAGAVRDGYTAGFELSPEDARGASGEADIRHAK